MEEEDSEPYTYLDYVSVSYGSAMVVSVGSLYITSREIS